MLTQIARTISELSLGEPIAESEEIYRTDNGKFRIHLGLFRKQTHDTLWLKFVHRSLMTRSSSGIGISVDTFQEFVNFLGSARSTEGVPRRIPLFPRIILAINEGVAQSVLLGEYKSRSSPKVVIRLFSFRNRRHQHKVVFQYQTSAQSTYEVFDRDVLLRLETEIANRQR